jgi:hypothetical protein
MFRRLALLAAAAWMSAAGCANAQELLDFRQVILCKSLRGDAERLQCFDRALSNAPTERTPPAKVVEIESDWQISENHSPADDLPQFAAVLQADDGTAALVMRCNNKVTDVYINLRTYVGGIEPLPVTYRFNDGAPIETRWLPSREGGAIFLGTSALAIAFARTLPDDATFYVKVRDFQNRSTDLTFKLGPVSDIRAKVAAACEWADSASPAPAQVAAATDAPSVVAATTRVYKHRHVQGRQQRWNINVQR